MKKTYLKKGRVIRIITAAVLSSALMIGSTFAWFSHQAASGVNTINAGNLGVALEYLDTKGIASVWRDAESHPLFNEGFLWEPGMVLVSDIFHVKNTGTLALKYELSLKINSETRTGDGHSLADVIKLGILDDDEVQNIYKELGNVYTVDQEREAYKKAVLETKDKFRPISSFISEGVLYPNDSTASGKPHESGMQMLVLYWEPNTNTIDNFYNGKGGKIEFGLNVRATQTPHEQDSFGNQYDANAEYSDDKNKLVDTGKNVEELKQSVIDAVGHGAVKSIVYGSWEKYAVKIGGKWADGNAVDEKGKVRSFYTSDTQTVYILTEHEGQKIAVPEKADHMFDQMTDLTELDLSGLDFSGVKSANYMFSGSTKLQNLDLSDMDFSSLESAASMFNSCTNLTSVDLTGADLSKVTDISGMFAYCINLEGTVDLSGVDFSKVTEIDNLFVNCRKITSVDFSNADLSNVADMGHMFNGCSSLTEVDLSSVKTSEKLKYLRYMFNDCNSLETIKFSPNFVTSGVINYGWMFNGCKKLAQLDLSGFDSLSAQMVTSMFNDCENLKTIYATEKFNLSSLSDANGNIFVSCNALTGGSGTKYSGSYANAAYARIDNPQNNKPGYFTAK